MRDHLANATDEQLRERREILLRSIDERNEEIELLKRWVLTYNDEIRDIEKSLHERETRGESE